MQVAKLQPGARQVRLQFDRAPQRGQRRRATPQSRQCPAKLQMGQRGARLGLHEAAEDGCGCLDFTPGGMGCRQQQHGIGLVGDHAQDFPGLLTRQGRIHAQQLRRMVEGGSERCGLFGRAGHEIFVKFPPDVKFVSRLTPKRQSHALVRSLRARTFPSRTTS